MADFPGQYILYDTSLEMGTTTISDGPALTDIPSSLYRSYSSTVSSVCSRNAIPNARPCAGGREIKVSAPEPPSLPPRLQVQGSQAVYIELHVGAG